MTEGGSVTPSPVELALRYKNEIWNAPDAAAAAAAIDALVAEGFRTHAALAGPDAGRARLVELARDIRQAFPAGRFEVEDVVDGAGKVAIRWRFRGRHEGPLLGIPASGKDVEVTGIEILRVEDGRVAELWANEDLLALLQQIGVVPRLGG
jgi:steroid delta-isomerase-like uncharacterized protein